MKFAANERYEFKNGAIGWSPGGQFDCLGPFAKVQNCPIYGTNLRRTCYATGYADTYFSVPAYTRIHGVRVSGYFSADGADVLFNPMTKYQQFVEDEEKALKR